MDHDQRFKILLQEFFPEFFDTFFPSWASNFDFSDIEWLKQELFLDPPQGERRVVDLVAKLVVKEPLSPPGEKDVEHWLTLIHVEAEATDSLTALRRRMYEYYQQLRRTHRIPVLPIALCIRVGRDGLGWDFYEEHYWEHRLLRFDFPYVGLPALDAKEYFNKENPLAVALSALMRIPENQRLDFGVKAWERVAHWQENEYRKYLLCECIGAYIPETMRQASEFESRLMTRTNKGETDMSVSVFERRELEASKRILTKQLEIRFETVPPEVRQKIATASKEQIENWLAVVITAESLKEMGLRD